MSRDPFPSIVDYYGALIDRFGHDPRACDYGHPASQERKFAMLAEAIGADDQSILDVGCGFADYWTFLKERHPELAYRGIDLSPRMIDEARKLHPELELEVGNVLDLPDGEMADVVSANGIFYLLGPNAQSLMEEIVVKMFHLCRRTVAFNSLSTWAPDVHEGEFHSDPAQTISFCSRLTGRVVLRHDYHPRDYTIYLYKR